MSRDTWATLAKTYASKSQSHITTHCTNPANPQQISHSILDYMQDIKRNMDALALMNITVDFDELSIRILNDLNPSFIELSHAIQVHDIDIDFDELFEKLLNYEAQLHAISHGSSSSPTTPRRTIQLMT